MSVLHTLGDFINNLNTLAKDVPWSTVANFVGASGLLSPLIVALKKWWKIEAQKKYVMPLLHIKFNGEQMMLIVVLIVSHLAAFGYYMLHQATSNADAVYLNTALLAFTTQPIYFFVVKPIIKLWNKQVEKAAAFNLEVKSAAVPAGGVPGSQDFNKP